MKTIIYLFLMAALLTGCVGKSFRTQRYTNFKHTRSAPSEEISYAKEQIQPHASVASPEKDEPVSCQAGGNNNPLVINKIINSEYDNILSKPVIKKEAKSHTKASEIKSKKNVKERSVTARGVIGTVFKIVLFVVILAVVISLIILVALL